MVTLDTKKLGFNYKCSRLIIFKPSTVALELNLQNFEYKVIQNWAVALNPAQEVSDEDHRSAGEERDWHSL